MSRYDQVREELDKLIKEVKGDNELYSLAISARLLLPQDNTPAPEAKVLLRQCLAMVSELWDMLDRRGFPYFASHFCARVELYLDDLHTFTYVEG